MDVSLRNKLSEVFHKYNFAQEDAVFVADVLKEIDERQYQKFETAKELFLTQKDKVEILDKLSDIKSSLTAKVYVTAFGVGLIQLLAIVGAVLTIINNSSH